MSAPKTATLRRTSRTRRHLRVRKKVSGSTARPRLVVFRSARHIYVQVVDDVAARTLVSASTLDEGVRGSEGDHHGAHHRPGHHRASGPAGVMVGQVGDQRLGELAEHHDLR